ncbi:TPA: prepilin [Escherichia coli]|nr:prepilin [Escherichia coli]
MPEGASVGGYKIKMYVDNKDNGLIALYGDEHYSLTIKSMKPFLGIRGASVEGDKIISTGGYYSLPVSGFTNFSTDNLRGLMLIPSIQTSGQNCDRGGYDF